MGSIKLIVASLLAAQLNGVIGSHDNRNSQKEQLRRNLRSASTTVKAQPDESQRDMQQMQGSKFILSRDNVNVTINIKT